MGVRQGQRGHGGKGIPLGPGLGSGGPRQAALRQAPHGLATPGAPPAPVPFHYALAGFFFKNSLHRGDRGLEFGGVKGWAERRPRPPPVTPPTHPRPLRPSTLDLPPLPPLPL